MIVHEHEKKKLLQKNKMFPTQKDIAESLGISRGSVDRALHDRKGICKETKEKIIQKADELGYSPNQLARFLVTGKTYRIALIIPKDPLWNEVKEGADSFLAGLGQHIINIDLYETNVHDPKMEIEILRQLLVKGIDGIGIAPADPEKLNTLINKAVERNIPVVTLNTDSPGSKRLCFVGQNPVQAGRIAGELMAKFLMGSGNIVIFTAFRNVLTHTLRLDSFKKVLTEFYPHIIVKKIYENFDNEDVTYQKLKTYLSQTSKIDGIFLTTGNGPSGVVNALRDSQLEKQVRIVCFNFFPNTISLLKSGFIHATIGEDPFNQGYQTIKILYELLVEKKRPLKEKVNTKIEIGLRENIDFLVKSNIHISYDYYKNTSL